MAIDISNKEEKQIALTGVEIESALLKANDIQSSASEIDNMVTNGATQADLEALALSTGNLTESQVTTINNLSGLAVDDSQINKAVRNNYQMPTSVGKYNLYDKTKIIAGFTVANGVNYSSATSEITNPIPVIAGEYIITSLAPKGKFNWFDKNDTFISQNTDIALANVAYLVPTNARYLRFTTKLGERNIMVVCSGGVLPSIYLPYGVSNETYSQIIDKQNILLSKNRNIIDGLNFSTTTIGVDGKYLSNDSGVLKELTLSNYYITEYLPVRENSLITVKTQIAASLVYYDANLNILQFTTNLIPSNTLLTVPTGAYYIRTSYVTNKIETNNIVYGDYSSELAQIYPREQGYYPWRGKRMFIQGDSITHMNAYFKEVCDDIYALQVENAARSGRELIDCLKHYDNTDLVASDFTNIDTAVLYLGENDDETTLGTIDDLTSSQTVYGYIKLFVETLLTWKPSLQIVLVTQLNTMNTNKLNEISQAMRDVGKLYSLPIIDLNKEAGFNYLTQDLYAPDGIHPSINGYKVLKKVFAGAFNRIFPNY